MIARFYPGAGMLCLLMLVLIAPQPTQGQSVVPLASPMLALNTVERDRIVLYDVTNNQYHDVQLGIGEH
ncbi:MAG: hypothetical protein AAF126_23550, partial [Chloroflexota bacterium]